MNGKNAWRFRGTGFKPVRSRAGLRQAQAASLLSGSPCHKGFTLIEFIVVMAIIGVLAAMIVPRFMGRVGGAKQAVARQKIAVLENKIMEFHTDCGRLPTSQEGLGALLQAPSDVSAKWKGPYVKEKDILDPWDAAFIYRYPGRRNADFDLFTLGADHQEAGEDENADIGNW